MNLLEHLIVLKGVDRTEEVSSYDFADDKVNVDFGKGVAYPYYTHNTYISSNPVELDIENCLVYVENKPLYDVKILLDFGKYIRVFYNKHSAEIVLKEALIIVQSGVDGTELELLEYFKDISKYTNDKALDENPKSQTPYLEKIFNELSFVHPESVLSTYLNKSHIRENTVDINNLIYPFRINLSQKDALENAVSNSISVIEGPPGTGKTQTILNLIANLINQRKTVAVVSGNNAAVKNVKDKLEKEGYGFVVASLGNQDNKKAFFDDLPQPKASDWDYEETFEELQEEINNRNQKINELLSLNNEKAGLNQKKRNLETEQEHFLEYYKSQNINEIIKLPFYRLSSEKIIAFLADAAIAKQLGKGDSLLRKLKLFFVYSVSDFKYLKEHEIEIILHLQRAYYKTKIALLSKRIKEIDDTLVSDSFDELLKEHQIYSECLLQKRLHESHSKLGVPALKIESYKTDFETFTQRYPVLLSTTHALKKSIPDNYLLDYVIIDEASQVDLLTGVLAFSCCKNIVIVGDTKQLPQITNSKIMEKLVSSEIDYIFDYFEQNILTSVMSLYGDKLPKATLKEHYRCHPKIIEFCNQKYYNGELIPFTSDELSENPLMIYFTSKGNHMRDVTAGTKKGKYNQRELDVVTEVLENPHVTLDMEDIGFTTPYRLQADKADSEFEKSMECDTIHKYQGREKNVMIMSTVLDSSFRGKTWIDFTDDPCKINVAVSRAIQQFILITDNTLFQSNGKEIQDLIKYIQYNTLDENVIQSEVISVFDLLYREYSDKLISFKKSIKYKSRFKSENIACALLNNILSEKEYDSLCFTTQVLLKNLILLNDSLTEEEKAYINNRASVDFVIYHKQDKKCLLIIEVDGFQYHENNPTQLNRDTLKDSILSKYEIPFLRLRTNASGENEKIRKKLNEIISYQQ